MVVAHLHLAEQTDSQEVEAGQQENRGEDDERAMLGHHVEVAKKFLHEQPQRNARPGDYAHHAHRPKEVQGTREITQQEADGNEIEEDPESPRNPVVRDATLTVDVANGHLADGSAMPGRQRGNKAVQLAVEWNLLENVAPVGFEGGAEVVDVHPAQPGHQPIGAARWDSAQPEVINPLLAPAADDVISFGNFLQKDGNIGRIVLQVSIHGDDVIALRMIEARRQRGSLPEIAPQAHYGDAAVDRGDLAQQVKGTVARAIVHQDNLEALPVGLHDRFQPVIQVGDILLFVMQRDDD